MTRRLNIVIGIVLLGFFLNGCVTPKGTAKPDPKLATEYVAKAQSYEKKGDLPAALENYKLALTVDPKNPTAKKNQKRLSKMLSKMADERYRLGMKYHRQGKYGLARKEFLTALKFVPDHPKASRMLVSREPDKTPKYIYHVVKKGESLSMIAKKYYGDFKKYDVIARFNKLKDATKVKPGDKIMIPDIKGSALPLAAPEIDRKITGYVMHTIRPGQSISKLAQQYYGDYKQFHIIAKYNKMDDATQVKVGQNVKIPKVAGLPFYAPGKTKPTPTVALEKTEPQPIEKTYPLPVEEPEPQPEVEPELSLPTSNGDEQILAYRDAGIELYALGKYEDAVFELNKAVEALPEDQRTRSFLAKAYFESGKQLFEEQYFDAAQEAFESARQYDPQCAQCQAYIDKSKLAPAMAHRSKGLEHLKKNEFKPAIAEFEAFLQVHPDDAEARGYVSKAHFQQALIDYNRGNFLTAKKGFESALGYDSQCQKCSAYITQSLESHKADHYNKGVNFYGKQQLSQAISEWELVYELDPEYKDVAQDLKKARELMQKLEKIKKSQKP